MKIARAPATEGKVQLDFVLENLRKEGVISAQQLAQSQQASDVATRLKEASK